MNYLTNQASSHVSRRSEKSTLHLFSLRALCPLWLKVFIVSLLIIFPITAKENPLQKAPTAQQPKPILNAPSLRIPAMPYEKTTVQELGFKNAEELLAQIQTSSGVRSVAFLPDNKWLASGSSDGTVKLWDVSSGELKQTLQASSRVSSVAFDQSGHLASGSYDGTVKLWDVSSGELKQTLQASSSLILSVAFDQSGHLGSGSDDGTVKLWDVSSSELKQTLQASRGGLGNGINSVAFDQSGHLVSGSDDGTVKLWDVSSGKLKTNPEKKRGGGGGANVVRQRKRHLVKYFR